MEGVSLLMGQDHEGRLPLHYAASVNKADQARARHAAGDDPNHGDREGFTALHLAAQEGSLDAAPALLDGGADVDPVNTFGNTPLFVAVFHFKGQGEMTVLLRSAGADPFRSNKNGQTPVDLARLIGNHDVAQLFADLLSP